MSDTIQQACSFPFDRVKFDRLFMESDALTLLNIRTAALVETIVFLSAAVFLNILIGDGTRYIGMSLHPFWIIVLLVTVQYGLKESITAALLASIFLLAGNLPEQPMSQSIYEYVLRVFSLPLMWLGAALVLGSIRERQLKEKEGLIDGLKKFEEAMAVIIDGYKTLKHSKEQLETRLAEERCSLLAVYSLARSLETLDPARAEIAAEKLVRTAINPAKFSIFRFDGNDLRLKSAYGWDENDSYAARFEGGDLLTEAIVDRKCMLSVAHRQEEELLKGQGLMAGPIYDEETGKVFGMLKIEDASFMNVGIRMQEAFRIVCSWIARMTANVEKYQAAVEAAPAGFSDIHVHDTLFDAADGAVLQNA